MPGFFFGRSSRARGAVTSKVAAADRPYESFSLRPGLQLSGYPSNECPQTKLESHLCLGWPKWTRASSRASRSTRKSQFENHTKSTKQELLCVGEGAFQRPAPRDGFQSPSFHPHLMHFSSPGSSGIDVGTSEFVFAITLGIALLC